VDEDVTATVVRVVPAAALGVLCTGHISWCISGMPASMPMGTIFNLYSFAQNNLQMNLI
jgi:hypothetical protein